MMFSGVPARAAVTHEYLSQITEVPGAPLPGPFISAQAMTVDGGELYVADGPTFGSEYRLDKFNASSGAFVAQFPQAPSSLTALHQGVAVGHATGAPEVYVAGSEVPGPGGAIAVFDATGALQGTWNGADTPSGSFGCFEVACVAVDESGGVGDWATGDVFVADAKHKVIDVFEPLAGGGEKYVSVSGLEPPGGFNEPLGVAVDQADGDVLVTDAAEGTNIGKVVDVFKPGALTDHYEFAYSLTGSPGTLFVGIEGVATDHITGNIFVPDNGSQSVDEFSASGAYLGRITGSGTPEGSFKNLTLRSVAVDPATHL